MDLMREKLRARGQHRAQFGFDGGGIGNSQSTSQTSTTQIDRRQTGGDGSLLLAGDGNSVSITDGGAVRAALAETALVFGTASQAQTATTAKALGFAGDAYAGALDAVSNAYSTAKAGDQRVVSMVGLAVLGLAAIFIFGKGR